LFRPGDVRVVSDKDGQLHGKISEMFFLGDRTRLHISGVTDVPIIVETTERREFHIGDGVGLKIEPEALLTLKD
jgi:putative spermidine/putrescine transport system ATP-binding protein